MDIDVVIESLWMGPHGLVVNTPDITVSMEPSSTAIMFRAVQLTDSGNYLCNVKALPTREINLASAESSFVVFLNVTGKDRSAL